jgi:predicted ribosomally synthesized peptide with nif11-like leader
MSLEIAKEFLKKTREQDDLYQKISAIAGDSVAAVRLGASLGYAFTVQELETASDELYGDLSDDDLASAAGGLGGMRPVITFP